MLPQWDTGQSFQIQILNFYSNSQVINLKALSGSEENIVNCCYPYFFKMPKMWKVHGSLLHWHSTGAGEGVDLVCL